MKIVRVEKVVWLSFSPTVAVRGGWRPQVVKDVMIGSLLIKFRTLPFYKNSCDGFHEDTILPDYYLVRAAVTESLKKCT